MANRWFTMVPVAVVALGVLAACGGTAQEGSDTTRVPDAANAPAVTETATEAPTRAASSSSAASPAASPAASMASPAAMTSDMATPAGATPAAGGMTASPVAAGASPMAGAASPVAGATSEAGATPAGEAAQGFTITANDIYFEPKALTIPAGQDVTISLPNEGAAPHNFAIDALNISVDLAPGETDATATINAPAGEYQYYCNVPGHKEAGMVGTLTVQ